MTDKIDANRRTFLSATAAAVALGSLAATRTSAQTAGATAAAGRRMLGALEVSQIGLGVQNVHRTFHTIVPNRAEMHNVIRTAFDNGVTFFDCAEVYGPHECERILGEAMVGFRNEIEVVTKFGFNVDLETGAWQPGLISRPDHIKA
ncbi:MAG: aldo/keto reductase, partial [Pseudomonadota bacterium]